MPMLSRWNRRLSIVVMTSATSLSCWRVDFLAGGVGKMRQRNPGDIDMRLRQLGGLRHHDMGVDVDGDGRGTAGEAVGIVDAGGGAAIAVLAIDHGNDSAVEGCLVGCAVDVQDLAALTPAGRNRCRVGVAEARRFGFLIAGQRACGDGKLGMERRGELNRAGQILFRGIEAERGCAKRRAAQHLGDRQDRALSWRPARPRCRSGYRSAARRED